MVPGYESSLSSRWSVAGSPLNASSTVNRVTDAATGGLAVEAAVVWAARLGRHFFIDPSTGVVIDET